MADHHHARNRVRERLVRIDCAHCGTEVTYKGTGRRPTYCSASCRSRAWELRRAAARLALPDPMPTVVREVVQEVVREVVERERLVVREQPEHHRRWPAEPGGANLPSRAGHARDGAPDRVSGWLPLLAELTRQVREQPLQLVRGVDDRWLDLAHAVHGLHRDLAWVHALTSGSPAGQDDAVGTATMSRQQRRARQRQRRKRG